MTNGVSSYSVPLPDTLMVLPSRLARRLGLHLNRRPGTGAATMLVVDAPSDRIDTSACIGGARVVSEVLRLGPSAEQAEAYGLHCQTRT